MTCWIIYDIKQYEHNKWFADRLTELCGQHCPTQLILAEYLTFGTKAQGFEFRYKGQLVQAPDIAVCRTIFPLLSKTLELSGATVFNNSEVARICNDKRLTYAIVHQMGLPVMKTQFCDRRFFSAGQEIEFPIILKTAMGHGGREVFMVNTPAELSETIASLPEDSFLLQDVCRPYGQDLRVFVLGGKIVCATMRTAESFRSNHALGGVASYYELSQAETTLVERVFHNFPARMDLVGIDFLPHEGGLIFNEIEDVVGCRMIYETSDIDISVMYTDYIFTVYFARSRQN